MAIISSEIKLYKSVTISNGDTNGGALLANLYTSNNLNNIFPAITPTQRTSGIELFRKAHVKFDNPDSTIASSAYVMVGDVVIDTVSGSPFLSETRLVMFDAATVGTQADIVGTERKYGAGRLNASVASGASVVVVDCALGTAADDIFQVSDKIWISNGTDENIYTIAGVSWVDDQATITIAETLLTDFAPTTTVSSIILKENVSASFTGWTETSGIGTYDETTYPPTLTSKATVSDDWLITFSSSTNFTVSGANTGSLGAGTIGTNFAPNNPSFSLPYFTILAAGWAGTWANGDTIAFSTSPCAIPVWLKLSVPAGAAACEYQSCTITTIVNS